MTFIYRVGILFYSLAVSVAALFNEKARLFVAGRKNWQKKLAEKVDPSAKYIWVHCASLGEFEQGRPVIEEIKTRFPHYKILLTFFSPSGYEIRKNYPLADIVAYLPVDTANNAGAFLDIVQPEKAFFVKYEYWYFFISELKRRSIPLFLVSAIFRENQVFFKNTPVGRWYRKMLFGVEHFFVQNDVSAKLLQAVDISQFTVSGDTRFDRVAAIAASAKEIQLIEKFRGNAPLVVAGSTWKPDEELLATFINNSNGVKFIIAPHEVSETNINRLQQFINKPAICFSKAGSADMNKFDVLIIDSIGLLSSVYRYGSFAYIGGGFGVGIHNILEAATFGLPVVFGPNFRKFKEAVDLTNDGGAFSISTQTHLNKTFNHLLTDKNALKNASEISQRYVAKNVGSTQIIIKKVFNIGPKNM